uniref:OTU domain-containing protein n=1 Tax=Panagrolaimus davidi TaxID=227884 RepID=A0A914PCH5_9BILA
MKTLLKGRSNVTKTLSGMVGLESSPILKAKRGTLVLSKFKTKDVRGDGNCGYRALSYLLTGSQDFHWQIRMRVMEHVVQNHKMFWMEGADGYPAYVSSYNTLVKYPKARGVQRKHWASDIDFLGFARLANINVYLYNPPDRQYNYSRCFPLIKEGKWDKEDGAFFVEWVNENHFIPIVGV